MKSAKNWSEDYYTSDSHDGLIRAIQADALMEGERLATVNKFDRILFKAALVLGALAAVALCIAIFLAIFHGH